MAGGALDTGRCRAAVPVRSAIIGVLAVVVVVASLTFRSSLDISISHRTHRDPGRRPAAEAGPPVSDPNRIPVHRCMFWAWQTRPW